MESGSRAIVELPHPPDNLCLLRLSALGDVTHMLPVVNALREAWPQTRITWIIGKLEHRLLQGLPGIEFLVFDKRGGRAARKQLQAALAGRRFDLLLQMQVALRANLLSRRVKAPVRLGWDRARSRDFHHWFTTHEVASVPFQHQVQGFLEFPRALGIAVDQPRWDLPMDPDAAAWAEAQLPGNQPTLIISPCSSHVLRNWRVERYAAVADFAVRKLGMRVVLSGGPSELERRTGAAIVAAMHEDVLNLVGQDTLTQSMAMLKRASVLLSPDSGPAHLASALGTPVVGLYAATWSKRSGPWNSLDLCVDRFAEAARKFRSQEPENLRWGTRIEEPGVMDLVEVEAVVEQLERAAIRAAESASGQQ